MESRLLRCNFGWKNVNGHYELKKKKKRQSKWKVKGQASVVGKWQLEEEVEVAHNGGKLNARSLRRRSISSWSWDLESHLYCVWLI